MKEMILLKFSESNKSNSKSKSKINNLGLFGWVTERITEIFADTFTETQIGLNDTGDTNKFRIKIVTSLIIKKNGDQKLEIFLYALVPLI